MTVAENARVTVSIQGQEFRFTRKEARSVINAITATLRQNFGAGTGRPKDSTEPRCPCGKMTVKRAARRYHSCTVADAGGKEGKAEARMAGKGEKREKLPAQRLMVAAGEKGKS